MYRALTVKAISMGINMEEEDPLVQMAKETTIDLEPCSDGVKVILDGKDVTEEVRSSEVTNNTFYVARAPRVREIMVEWQREIGAKKSVVVEGRDTGTIVFPDAKTKFYLDANVEERSQRRMLELQDKGIDVDMRRLEEQIVQRDHSDKSRDVGPLKLAKDAHFIDSTNLNIDQVVEKMLEIIEENGSE